MEEKVLKTSIFVNSTVLNETAEQAIDVDFTLPDYCPDISKIFKCRAVSRITSKSINGKTITVDGFAAITLLYCDSEGRLCSYEYQYPFSKSLEMSEEAGGCNISVRSKCEYINCRAITGRKVDIHGAIGIYIRVFKRKANDVFSDIDDPTIEQKRNTAPATVPMGYSEKYLLSEEDISLSGAQPPIQKIIRYDAKPCVKESKIINGKIMVKGDISVWVLYCAEGTDALQSVKSVIPFSQIVDMEGITETCECETKCELVFLEVKPRATEGEIKCLSLAAKLLLCCEAYCGNDITVISDAFSKKELADFKQEQISIESICDKINESFHCKKNIELNSPISSVCDLWCDVQSVSTKFTDDSMLISGTVIACVIALSAEGGTIYFEKSIDFEYKYNVSCEDGELHSEPQVEIISCGYTITSADSLELRIDLGINAAVYKCIKLPVITEMKLLGKEHEKKKQTIAMAIYFTGENEYVWDIAKHYGAAVDEIVKINDLTEEALPENRMLLIPVN